MLWICNKLHLIFIYIPIKMQMFFTFQKPCVMYPLNFLNLFHVLSLMSRCHLWYLLPLLPQLFLCGDVIYDISTICLVTCTMVGITIPLLALQVVPLCPSSFFMPSNLCFHVPSSFLRLRFHLLQLCFYSCKHFLESLLQLSFCSLVLCASLPQFF